MKKSLGADTLIYPAPTWVIGTYDKAGKPNVMTASWVGICCSQPPCISVSLRKATYSYGNIVQRKAFTVGVPSVDHAKEADYFGMASGRDVDKFSATGLKAVRGTVVDAPFVDEFPLVLECILLHSIEIGLHTQFIGQIMDVKADESVLGTRGLPDMEKVRPFVFAPKRQEYYEIGSSIGKAFSIGEEFNKSEAEKQNDK